MQMDKLIAQFFPIHFEHLFLYYIVVLCSLEKLWAQDVYGIEKAYEYNHLAFVRYTKPMKSANFSKALYNSSLEYLNIGLGIHD
jgi:hypothetical protein